MTTPVSLLARIGFALFAAVTASVSARAGTLLEAWPFADSAGTPLHLAANAAPGRTTPSARWDVAIPGLAVTGAGT
ncbi:MAG: hypothetical protein H7067_01620, partial [Burkholderiales bacterium]|nr:hypothetical protein [Opitutaceae bacterium]